MEEKNELNDIILNRSNGNSSMKKVMLAVASLAILLIIVVVIMSSLNSEGTTNLPQPIEPPKEIHAQSPLEEDPLFEPIPIDETASEEESLNSVAKKIKEQSQQEQAQPVVAKETEKEEVLIEEPTEVVVPAKYEKPVKKESKKVTSKASTSVPAKKVPEVTVPKPAVKGNVYVQVGSFSRYAPDKKFLKKITDGGYTYTLHKVDALTKVLIGPFETDKAARKELKTIRTNIERGAFLSRI